MNEEKLFDAILDIERNPKPKPILITFQTPEAACRFVDAILEMKDGKGIIIHMAGKELEDFAERYVSNKGQEN